MPSGCQVVQLETEGFGVYVVCRTADALLRFMASNVSQQFSRVLESVYSKLSGEKIVVVQLNWVQDYRRCAEHFISANVGEYSHCCVDCNNNNNNNNSFISYHS